MVNHSALCRSIKYDYMNSLTWTILKKTQILNGCETFAFKYIQVHFRLDFFMLANNMNPDQTAPAEQSDQGSYCLQYRLSKNISRR